MKRNRHLLMSHWKVCVPNGKQYGGKYNGKIIVTEI